MRRFLVTLKQLNNTEVLAVVDGNSKEDAAKKALTTANTAAKGGQSKVITSTVPLKVIKVETWEDCSLRVVKGDKQYGVLFMTQHGRVEDIVRGVAGIKSAYSYVIKQYQLKEEVRVFIVDIEQKTNVKKCECVECGNKFTKTDVVEIYTKVPETYKYKSSKTGKYICKTCLETSKDYKKCFACCKVYDVWYMKYGQSLESHCVYLCNLCEWEREYIPCEFCLGASSNYCFMKEEDLIEVNTREGKEYACDSVDNIFKCEKCKEYYWEGLDTGDNICIHCEDCEDCEE